MQNLDLFPSGFRLTIQGQKGKKTVFGAILTILIFSVGLAYLIYLLYYWLSGGMEPNIQSHYNLLDLVVQVDEPPYMFALITQNASGTYPVDLSYYGINTLVGLSRVDPNLQSVKTVDCAQYYPQYAGYQCPDMSNPAMAIKPDFWSSIQVFYCFNESQYLYGGGSTVPCKSMQEQISFLSLSSTEFEIVYVKKYFDVQNRKMQTVFQPEHNIYDPNQFVARRIIAKLADIDIDNGVLFQDSQAHFTFDEFDEDMLFITKETAVPRYQNISLICNFYNEFSLDSQFKTTTVQFPRLGAVLAEFSSIFNVLLILGISAKFISQKETFKLLEEVVGKHFYGDERLTDSQKQEVHLLCSEFSRFEFILEELLRLKKAVQLLYEPRQWAMLDKIGTKDQVQQVEEEETNTANPLLQFHLVDKEIEYKKKMQDQFLALKENIDQLDRKILNCLENKGVQIKISKIAENKKDIILQDISNKNSEIETIKIQQQFQDNIEQIPKSDQDLILENLQNQQQAQEQLIQNQWLEKQYKQVDTIKQLGKLHKISVKIAQKNIPSLEVSIRSHEGQSEDVH